MLFVTLFTLEDFKLDRFDRENVFSNIKTIVQKIHSK